MADIIQLRRDLAANWTSINPILADGEIGYEKDSGKFKVGNAAGTWTVLSYFQSFPGFDTLFNDYSFTDNSANWNTSFNWGNHAGLYLTDAPSDGSEYVRKDAAWTIATGGGGGAEELIDLTDVTGALTTDKFALMGNGSSFVSRALVEADISNFGTYETAFSKNTGFNLVLGSGSGQVAEGNHTHTFASLTSKPTTISGYGITDAFTKTESDNKFEILTDKGQNNGYAPLDSSGKLPTVHLPALAISDTFVIATEAAMLLLTAETGDVAVRTDENKSYILQGTDASLLTDWQELLAPTDAVSTVNGLNGTVILNLGFADGSLSITGGNSVDLDARYPQLSHSHTFASLTSKPTTLGGYAIVDTKVNYNSSLSNGSFMFLGDAPTSHTHLLAAGATDVTAIASELNLLDLAGLTTGWVLSADSANTASWKAPTGGGGSPLTTKGDIFTYDTGDQRLAISGNDGWVLAEDSSEPTGLKWVALSGGGDMLLGTAQTVTANKTFLNTTFLLRNVANTFNGSFLNTNTADRVYTLKDSDGILAFTTDITGTNSGTNTGDNSVNTLYDSLVSNVTTNLSFSRTATTLTVISSDGSNAILVEADTTNAGLLGSDKWDEIVENTLKTSNIIQTDLSSISDNKANFNTSLSDGSFLFVGDAPTAHSHTFASLTSKPTTIGGYGITDFNSLGDARWALTGHIHNAFDRVTSVLSGATVFSDIIVTDGIVTGIATRALTASDISAEASFSKNTGFNLNLGTGAGQVSEGNHTHTFASLTSKPTTIGGYGITDFNSLGDARWSLLAHNHNDETIVVGDHGTASVDEVVNVSYGTSATPPTANTTTEGSLYIQYTP